MCTPVFSASPAAGGGVVWPVSAAALSAATAGACGSAAGAAVVVSAAAGVSWAMTGATSPGPASSTPNMTVATKASLNALPHGIRLPLEPLPES
jgi:hypothetical protein